MEAHYLLTDNEFKHAFESCKLDPALFTHEAHLRLAWIHLRKYGAETAIINITNQLKDYTRSLGAAHKYNETVTIAAIRAVHHFMVRSSTHDFRSFIEENPRLKYNFKELLAHHYSTDIFKSEAAKAQFLEPELLSFD